MNPFLRLTASLFYRPPILQMAALCLRGTGEGAEVLLIRSLDSKRWILPKGWPMRGKTLAEAAEIEAWEEAGVTGEIEPDSIGNFASFKRRANGLRQRSTIEVFALHVADVAKDFPEADMRESRWFPVREAMEKLKEPELSELIADYLSLPQ
ncbi:NUDIX hydrolase [Pseudorhodobacter aquimaris]|uniref:NUDIX hydrolase n=1 Tax=Pseudorhodobacter aquimaris TaxID=687412 RepID=UPI00067B860E|nr:NUDIX hydrolase [Pseudorhodobacter aquimaris]